MRSVSSLKTPKPSTHAGETGHAASSGCAWFGRDRGRNHSASGQGAARIPACLNHLSHGLHMPALDLLGSFQDPKNLDQGASKLVNVRVVPREMKEGKPAKVRFIGAPGLTPIC